MSIDTISVNEQHDVMRAINELRSVAESKNKHLSENVEKMEKINLRLDEFDSINNKLTKEIMEAKDRENDLKKEIEILEKHICKIPAGGKPNNGEMSPARKAFDRLIRVGEKMISQDEMRHLHVQSMSPETLKYLRTDVNIDGGFLIPQDFVDEIIKNIVEISDFLPLARVISTNGKDITIPSRDVEATAFWVGEGQTKPETQPQYGEILIPANKIAAVTLISSEMLSDSPFNMMDQIRSDLAEQFARLQGAAFINGTGVNMPRGILQHPDVQIILSEDQNTITGDNFMDLFGELKTGYNPIYLMNRRTAALVRKLKDGTGEYIWAFGLQPGAPAVINGIPWMSMIDMPDVVGESAPGAGDGSKPVILGDFKRGYVVLERETMGFLVNPYTFARNNKTELVADRRVGGDVVRPESMKILQVGVTP